MVTEVGKAVIVVNANRDVFQIGGQQGDHRRAHLMCVDYRRPGDAQLVSILCQPPGKSQRIRSEIRAEMPLRHGNLANHLAVTRLVLEPKFGVDAVLVQIRHHWHHKIPRADREMDRVDDLGHGNRPGVGF